MPKGSYSKMRHIALIVVIAIAAFAALSGFLVSSRHIHQSLAVSLIAQILFLLGMAMVAIGIWRQRAKGPEAPVAD